MTAASTSELGAHEFYAAPLPLPFPSPPRYLLFPAPLSLSIISLFIILSPSTLYLSILAEASRAHALLWRRRGGATLVADEAEAGWQLLATAGGGGRRRGGGARARRGGRWRRGAWRWRGAWRGRGRRRWFACKVSEHREDTCQSRKAASDLDTVVAIGWFGGRAACALLYVSADRLTCVGPRDATRRRHAVLQVSKSLSVR